MLHTDLLSRIWGPEFRDEVRYLRIWISRLRAKIDRDGAEESLITTFPGIGYRFASPEGGGAMPDDGLDLEQVASRRHGSPKPRPLVLEGKAGP
jgi:DNA-binding winged helix-turn-helix (wHTH) protein